MKKFINKIYNKRAFAYHIKKKKKFFMQFFIFQQK